MIPRANITAWRAKAPWPDDAQVEQDLVLSRAIVEIFRVPLLRDALAFRGGTALHKLFFHPPRRYSEDIDLVQRDAGPIGAVLNALRDVLDSWLGKPQYKLSKGRTTFIYRFETTALPVRRARLKIEINTREHFAVLGIAAREFSVESPWFAGSAELTVYELEELLGTKLRALYQRKKGRDLFDLWLALDTVADLDESRVVECFQRYMKHGQTPVSRAQFEANIAAKLADPVFLGDLGPLLPSSVSYEIDEAAAAVLSRLVARIPGDPWKGDDG